MIVDHSRCLHKCVANGRSDKPEAALLQVFAEGVGFGSFCRNTLVAFPAVLFGLPADEAPHVRFVRVALRRRAAQTKRLEKPQECSCKNCRIRRPQQRPAEARLPVCRIDHLLRTYAGNGNGQRSSGKLLSVSRFVEIEVSVQLSRNVGTTSIKSTLEDSGCASG